MKKYKFNIKFAEISKAAEIGNCFVEQREIPEKNYEFAVVRALYDAQSTLRTLEGNWFFRVEKL